MTGITVKFGSRHNPIKASYSYRFPGDAEMFVEINGGVSRIATRPYNSCYYYIANEIKKENAVLYNPVVLPNYEEVINDKEGKQFKFVECRSTQVPKYSSSIVSRPIPDSSPPIYGS